MLQRPERWLCAHWGWRFASWLAVLTLMYGAAGGLSAWIVAGFDAPQQARSAVRSQTQVQYASLRQMAAANAALSAGPPMPALRPFSALTLSHESRSRLVSWQPGLPHSELILEVDWPQLPSLFALLGEQHVEPEGFILRMSEQVLTLTLRLGESK